MNNLTTNYFCVYLFLLASFASYQSTAMVFAGPTKIFVDSSSLALLPDGLTWGTAYPNLQDAIELADSGDTICVAKGTYYPDEGSGQIDNAKASTFTIPSEVMLLGGFPSSGGTFALRDYLLNPTILSVISTKPEIPQVMHIMW